MLALLLSLSTAAANGQSTHVWISRRALELLPEGELKELLSAQEAALVHGTMFPDGGYPLGDPYAEIAHWEPFQGLYMEWIQDRYAAPWEGQAAHEVAFLFGMASHGMADQSFDACYFNWSSIYDADHGWAAGESFDEASDVIWSSIVGGQELPAQDVPYETLTALYDAYGEPTDIETMQEGQNILELAIGMAGLAGQSPELVESYAAEFPWGGSHLDFHGLPGTPEDEAHSVALYWQELWGRLNELEPGPGITRTWPEDGGPIRALEADAPPARLTLYFARGLSSDEVDPSDVMVQNERGEEVPVSTWLYYGNDSHVLHLVPQQDWEEDMDYEVRVLAGLPFRRGGALEEEVRYRVTTRAPAVPSGETAEPSPSTPEEEAMEGTWKGGGCSGGAAGLWGFLGLGLRRRKR